jgi:hypothetical protein
MLTVIDIDEATIEAEAAAQQWEREFQDAFTKPLQVMRATMSMLAVPPEFGKLAEGPLSARAQARSEKMRMNNDPRRVQHGQPV